MESKECENGLFVTNFNELSDMSWKLLTQQYSLSEKELIKHKGVKNGN